MKRRWLIAAATMLASTSALAADLIPWRMTSGSNWNNGYAPGPLGFNLADVSSLSILNLLPEGVKGLLYVGSSNGGCSGDSPQFRALAAGSSRGAGSLRPLLQVTALAASWQDTSNGAQNPQ
jgi:hypothetical protein